MNDSYQLISSGFSNHALRHNSKRRTMTLSYLLVDIQFPEDLRCVQKMVLIEDPARHPSALLMKVASVDLTSLRYMRVMAG